MLFVLLIFLSRPQSSRHLTWWPLACQSFSRWNDLVRKLTPGLPHFLCYKTIEAGKEGEEGEKEEVEKEMKKKMVMMMMTMMMMMVMVMKKKKKMRRRRRRKKKKKKVSACFRSSARESQDV